jgi:hypothetical protein
MSKLISFGAPAHYHRGHNLGKMVYSVNRRPERASNLEYPRVVHRAGLFAKVFFVIGTNRLLSLLANKQ